MCSVSSEITAWLISSASSGYAEDMIGTRFRDKLYRQWLEVRKPKASDFDGMDSEGYYYVVNAESGRRVFVSHQRRLGYYAKGVAHRVSNLAHEYQVSQLVLKSADRVIDVGAHSGEFGLWVEQSGAHYLGIEPDPVAFGALQRNFPNSRLLNIALGEKTGYQEFYLATSTGDSSFASSTSKRELKVQVETLDSVASDNFPVGRITLLKVEAEGFEPEVFAGGIETLKRTDFVTVDAGEERSGLSTAPECLNLLFSLGFTLKSVFLRRGIFLLENIKQGEATI